MGTALIAMLLGCNGGDFEVHYQCEVEVLQELSDPDEVSVDLGISPAQAGAWMARDVQATFAADVIHDEPIQAHLNVAFTPTGPHRVVRRVGDGPACDSVPFLESEGLATLSIGGYASVAGAATLISDGDASWLQVASVTVVEPEIEQAFLGAKGPCSQVDYGLSAGSHEARLSYSAFCDGGTEGGFLLQTELEPQR